MSTICNHKKPDGTICNYPITNSKFTKCTKCFYKYSLPTTFRISLDTINATPVQCTYFDPNGRCTNHIHEKLAVCYDHRHCINKCKYSYYDHTICNAPCAYKYTTCLHHVEKMRSKQYYSNTTYTPKNYKQKESKQNDSKNIDSKNIDSKNIDSKISKNIDSKNIDSKNIEPGEIVPDYIALSAGFGDTSQQNRYFINTSGNNKDDIYEEFIAHSNIKIGKESNGTQVIGKESNGTQEIGKESNGTQEIGKESNGTQEIGKESNGKRQIDNSFEDPNKRSRSVSVVSHDVSNHEIKHDADLLQSLSSQLNSSKIENANLHDQMIKQQIENAFLRSQNEKNINQIELLQNEIDVLKNFNLHLRTNQMLTEHRIKSSPNNIINYLH